MKRRKNQHSVFWASTSALGVCAEEQSVFPLTDGSNRSTVSAMSRRHRSRKSAHRAAGLRLLGGEGCNRPARLRLR
jgi:hypothetical protein